MAALTPEELLQKKQLLRPDEVASILRVSIRTVYNMVSDGRLSSPDLGIKSVRIHSGSLRELIKTEET